MSTHWAAVFADNGQAVWTEVVDMPPNAPLFVDTAFAPARDTDPVTSHEAGQTPGKSIIRRRVLRSLLVNGAQHDEAIAESLDLLLRKPSVGKRRQELVEAGFVEAAEDEDGTVLYGRTASNCRAILWRLTRDGVQAAMDDKDTH